MRFLPGLLAAFTLALSHAYAQTTVPITGSFVLPAQPAAVDYGPKLDAIRTEILAAIAKLGTGTTTPPVVTPPVVTPPSGPPAGPVTIPPADALKDFTVDAAGMKAGDWSKTILPSDWRGSGIYAYNPANVKLVNGALVLTADDTGAAEINYTAQTVTIGAVTMDATISALQPGRVVAPVWLFNNANKEELDIEVLPTGVQLAVHNAGVYGFYTKLVKGNYSGRHIWRIEYQAGVSVSYFVDGKLLATVMPADLKYPYDANGKKLGTPAPEMFPKTGLKASASNWQSGNVGWVGAYVKGQPPVVLTLHAFQRNKVF